MIRSTLLVLSEGITLDAISSTTSLYNIIESIQIQKFPAIMPKLCMLTFMEKNEGDKQNIQIDAKLFNNDVLLYEKSQNIDFQNKLRHKWLNVFGNVKIENPGKLYVSIFHDGNEVNRYSIDVIEQKIVPPTIVKKK